MLKFIIKITFNIGVNNNMNKVAIISLSNGIKSSSYEIIDKLINEFSKHNVEVVKAKTLYANNGPFAGTPKERAIALIDLFKDNTIEVIFDVSGGDLANEVLPYLDFEIIKNNWKPFFGYSDLSVILNSFFSQISKETYLYQVRNIIDNKEISKDFFNLLLKKNTKLLNFKYDFIRGTNMEGVLIGGNLRCTLKLSGTKYMPNFENKIILIESLGGDVSKITTYLNQYKQLGAFEKCTGILLGQFTELESNKDNYLIEDIITQVIDNPKLPIARTLNIGHSKDSKCAIIGKHISL